jgi:cobalt-zinc-cadmium efflux system protein
VGHSHGHSHSHSHAPAADADRRWLELALAIVVVFMALEVVGGLLAHSLALLSDAGHMVTDAAALALALVAGRLAARPAGGRYTFGLGRAEILSAQVNGAALLVLAGVLGVAAVLRLFDPPDVDGGIVLAVGAAGGAANVASAWALSRAQRRSLNVEGARQHVLMDLYGSAGAALAGIVVLATGFDRADPIVALLVAALMLRSGWRLVRESSRILLEASPRDVDPAEIGMALAAVPGVVEVHDLHVWEVTSGFPALAAHVTVAEHDDCHALRDQLAAVVSEGFGIDHVTLQVDHRRADALLAIQPAKESGGS